MSGDTAQHYYVPEPTHWPIIGSLAILLMASGAVMWMNALMAGRWVLAAGLATLVYMMFRWFSQVARESEGGRYNRQVDGSYRWAMSWFIFSEVMFFAALFGALFYVRVISVPDLGAIDNKLLWPDFSTVWPNAGPGFAGRFTPMSAWGIPALNTLLLLTSGVTLTIAHWGLKENKRGVLSVWLLLTVVLGATFLAFQAFEYGHAYSELNLKLSTGVYGSTFFMLTGFHGLHVTIGAIMLSVILFRCLAGHFTPQHHFAFEAVSWYWHFVDVVWLLLFIVVYWV